MRVFAFVLRQAVHVGDELQKLSARKLVVKIRLVGHVAHELVGVPRLCNHVEVAHANRPRR